MIKNHPRGLLYLFFAEMWERFSYYGMRAILVLYCVAKTQEGGLGMSQESALYLYGIYTAFVYFMSIPGGYLADKVLGQKKSVMYGGFLIIVGHTLMTFSGLMYFYSALVFIILGTGMLKPNISSLVGGLYSKDSKHRESGFIIFYMGINLGAFLSSIIVSEVAQSYGWHYGFGLAAIGMALGQVVFISGQPTLAKVGNLLKPEETKKYFAPLTSIEKDRLLLVFISFIIVWIFFAAFEQAGGLMNIYTDLSIDRNINLFNFKHEIAAGSFQSTNAFFILLFGSAFVGFLGYLNRKGIPLSTMKKFGLSTLIASVGFLCLIGAIYQGFEGNLSIPMFEPTKEQLVKSHLLWIIGAYMFHTIGELFISPIALSFVTRLSPEKYTSRMMGAYFAVTGLGNFVAGFLGAQSEKLGAFNIFFIVGMFLIIFGLVLLAFEKRLNKLAHGME